MATASGGREGTRRLAMTVVACAVVLALLGVAGVFWMRGEGGLPSLAGRDLAPPAAPPSAAPPPAAVQQTIRSLKVPPRPAPAEATKQEPAETLAPAPEPAREPAASSPPSKSEAANSEPTKSPCTADVGAWPSDKTEQGKAIQILLRDLGFYSGNTYGTVGPATRAAIRKFELAADQAETGEPTEMLFESLKKKCAAPVR